MNLSVLACGHELNYFDVPTTTCLKCKSQIDKRQEAKTGIDATLEERGARYGSFTGHAEISQSLKLAMHSSPNWYNMGDDMRECLEMVAHKIGRILNGDPYYHDSWHDIIGYTKLVADRLAKE